MPDQNGSYDWNKHGEEHDRIWRAIDAQQQSIETLFRNDHKLRDDLVRQKENVDNLVSAIRDLIDRIPPENLR